MRTPEEAALPRQDSEAGTETFVDQELENHSACNMGSEIAPLQVKLIG
jgi:hypothetical protein